MKNRHYMTMILLTAMCFLSEGVQAQNDRQFIRNGNHLYRQQNFAKAEIEYRKAIGQNGQNPQALYNLGCALMMQQKDSAAIVQYEHAAKLETSKMRKAKVYHNIGVICQTHQMFSEAIQAYQESLRNNPNDNETRYNLALCKRQEKKQKQNNGGGKNDDKQKKDKDKNKQSGKNKNQQDKDKQNNKQQPQPQDQMSKENAEQMLSAAVQEEKATQQRLKKAVQQPRRRQLQRNW